MWSIRALWLGPRPSRLGGRARAISRVASRAVDGLPHHVKRVMDAAVDGGGRHAERAYRLGHRGPSGSRFRDRLAVWDRQRALGGPLELSVHGQLRGLVRGPSGAWGRPVGLRHLWAGGVEHPVLLRDALSWWTCNLEIAMLPR